MYKEWGPIVWIFLHTITTKIKDGKFHLVKKNVFEIISQTCYNLPCPRCRQHATNFLSQNKISRCNTKESLISYIFNFHNIVNKRLGKKMYEFKDLEKYKRCRFNELIKRFESVLKKQYYFTKSMDGWKRIKNTDNILKILIKNQNYFNK